MPRTETPGRAFSLLEIVICLLILSMVIVPIVDMFTASGRTAYSAHRLVLATMAAQTLLEAVAELEPWEIPQQAGVPEWSLLSSEFAPPPAPPAGRWPQVQAYFAQPTPFEMERTLRATRLSGGHLLLTMTVRFESVVGDERTLQEVVLEAVSTPRS